MLGRGQALPSFPSRSFLRWRSLFISVVPLAEFLPDKAEHFVRNRDVSVATL